jgi:hypothetical protein
LGCFFPQNSQLTAPLLMLCLQFRHCMADP